MFREEKYLEKGKKIGETKLKKKKKKKRPVEFLPKKQPRKLVKHRIDIAYSAYTTREIL